jgi:AmmeMemoRadiSam system protein B/AmmeMemoRadiSam system protein A
MRTKTFLLSLSLFICTSLVWSQGTRKPIVAELFYDNDADRLSKQIDLYLQNVKQKTLPSGEILALIAPHAGYVYSGQVAAHAYRLVQAKDYKAVVIIGPSHRYGFKGCSIYSKGAYQTPLGTVEVDEALASELSKVSGFEYVPEAHQQEHSIEVQIPFIQKTLPDAKIVPVVMGFQSRRTIATLAHALSIVLPGKKALVIASTDLSHLLSKQKATEIDSGTISLIQSFETDSLIKKLGRGENIMCGGGPVVSALLYTQGFGDPGVKVLQRADSSDAGASQAQVVGYVAAALYHKSQAVPFHLPKKEKKELLKLAKSSIAYFLKEEKILEYKTQNPNLLAQRGAFVTLENKGILRGCIGLIEPIFPLYETVIRSAIYAACQDYRFPPVTDEELNDLEIEVSVLTAPEKIRNPQVIEVGRHGLIIVKGANKGLLLPQVAVENGWGLKEFLERACLKAGLPRNAWKTGADMYIFEAIVFR